jgi:hypothetical protein
LPSDDGFPVAVTETPRPEQKELISNLSLVRTVHRTVKKDGVRTVVETQQRVRPWWQTDEKGQVVFFVRIGWKLLEFEKGKTGVLAGTTERLPAVIETLIEAVMVGELDPALAQSRAALTGAKKRPPWTCFGKVESS